jgi:hypothetical protein
MSSEPTSEARGDGSPLPANVPPANYSQPTIGGSYDVDKGARSLFENWLPQRWLPRKQIPDYHVDYRVEVVSDGEPSGLHFQVQVKGRSVHRRKAKKLGEPIKTKHLRYWLRCQEPVFVFLIDPMSKEGNWLFIQRYLREGVRLDSLRTQKTLTVEFDAQHSLENRMLFEKELRDAWSYMRDLYPGSPMAAALAEKQRLEQLDPRFSVQVEATPDSKKVQLTPRQPMADGPKLKFLKKTVAGEVKAFYEKGQSFRVKATEIEVDAAPIISNVLRELGDAEITINSGARFKGHLHLVLHAKPSPPLIQIDGEWLLAPKLISFKGQLSESPLRVELVCEANEGGEWEPCAVAFKFNWGAWEQQPLLSLAYFSAINDFIRCEEFSLSGYIRGNQVWKGETFTADCQAKKPAADAMDWFQKCRHVAQQVGANPLFPRADALEEIESNDVRLMVELFEHGRHEQSNVGQTVGIAADIQPENKPPINFQAKKMSLPEHTRLLNFFGMQVPFGPLVHTWTDVRLVALNPLQEGRTELMWEGEANSIYRIEYERKDENRSESETIPNGRGTDGVNA